MPYYIYIVACTDGALYTGYARNVKARFKQHKLGKGARYLKTHQPDKIVYKEKFASRAEAMKRERAIKRLTHAQKLKLASSLEK